MYRFQVFSIRSKEFLFVGKVIAIDGPSGVGKSTLARMLSESTGFDYLDTGALYRATALGLVRAGLDEDATDEEIAGALEKMSVEFKGGKAMLDGKDVSGKIRTPEAGHYSSVFSARRPVRDFLMPVQQRAARDSNLVAEGRDMGTVVFPDAWKKFYLVATLEERADRRFRQLRDTDKPITSKEAARDVSERDERDSSRDIAPLARAADAIEIESSGISVDEVFGLMIREVKAK